VFPDRSNLAELASLVQVRLDQTPFPLLLLAHHAIESTGMLVAKRGPIEKRVLLDQGVPVDCRSNLVHETLSRFLVAAGRLSDADANELLGRSVAQGRLLGDLLVAEGKIEAADLQRLLQQSLARKLFDLFTWKDGEIRFEAAAVPSAAALKVKVARLVLTGVERFVPQEVVDRAVGPLAGTLVVADPAAGAQRDELRPNEKEQALLAALARPQRIEELVAQLGSPVEELARQLWALALLGIVVPADRLASGALPKPAPPQAPPPPPPAPIVPAPPAPVPAPPAPGLGADDLRRIREQVRHAYATFRRQDAFDLLGAGEDATALEIRDRLFAYAKRFAPWRFEAPELRSLAEEAKELFAAGAIAYGKLADLHAREAMRAERRRAREEARREASAAYFRIETDLLDASVQFEKGLALRQARKLPQALQQFEFAADCDPQNGTYLAEAAYCRFLLAPSTNGARALADLAEAQRIDPESAAACLYAGEIAAQLGRLAEAERHYRKAAKLLGPDDRRALDALRDLAKRKKK
jgi:hypothetical protein